ncbi:hypothetical protein [Caulobacter sp. 602-1]|uniref:hypothetical protein n=1 Tax=Caulobacter sp. 602-1 TaxID=2492472 RepID=UPI000F62FDE5|nr:hypothetical protein [Caulobacter sp. 602-1]RRN65347.1 hypothetical protein EIK80_07295 [Caulobacter sp. 602-1]
MFEFIRKGFGNLAEDIARQSREWKIRCTKCGHQKSLTSVGGIRYGAAGTKYTLGTCSKCNGFRILKIYRSATPQA